MYFKAFIFVAILTVTMILLIKYVWDFSGF